MSRQTPKLETQPVDHEPRRSVINTRLSRELAKTRIDQFRSMTPVKTEDNSTPTPQTTKYSASRKTSRSRMALVPAKRENHGQSPSRLGLDLSPTTPTYVAAGITNGPGQDATSSDGDKPKGQKINKTALILVSATGSTEIIVGPPRNLQPTAENCAMIEFENELARLYAHVARLETRLAIVAASVADIKSERAQ